MACLKGGVVANVVIPTAEYVRLASHYGFAPDFCHAADPESKGIVENLCGYAQRDLAVPLLTEAAIAGVPVDLRSANAAARAWCVEVNAAMHSEICAVPDERLIVERELLRPLPSLRLQIGAPSVLRKVDRLSCVRYASARYSVPTRLIGASVAVVLDHGAVCLVEPSDRDDRGRARTRRPGQRLDPRRALRRATTSTAAAGHAPKQRLSSSSVPWVRTPKRSWSAPRRSATPAWDPSWRSCSGWAPLTARRLDRGVAPGGGVPAVPCR